MKNFAKFCIFEHPVFTIMLVIGLLAFAQRLYSGYYAVAMICFTFFCWGIALLANIYFYEKSEEAVELWKDEAKRQQTLAEFYRRKLEGKQ